MSTACFGPVAFLARNEMQAAISDDERARQRRPLMIPRAFAVPARSDRIGTARGPAVLALALMAIWLAACQTTTPVPVEVRAAPGSTPAAGLPGSTAEALPPGATAEVVPAGPITGSPPVGPSGQPLRTEPYGLKRGYGEPPRQVASQPGSGGAAVAGGVRPSAVAGGAVAGGGAAGAGVTAGASAGAGAGAGSSAGADVAVAPPVVAPTVLPPASSLEQKPPVSLNDPGAGRAGAGGSGAAAQPPDVVATAPSTAPAPARGSGSLDGVRFGWPLKGTVLQDFDQTSGRGLSLGTRPRANVAAAADGKVIFSGAGPREYGNLIIIRHAGDLLSVYANNSSLAVKEGQDVRRGQKIAEAGGAANRPQLHFEIRQQGKPIDPLTVLQPQ